MRTKQEILNELHNHTLRLDPQHKELAAVAMVETEVQIDIRDNLNMLVTVVSAIEKIVFRSG